MSEGDVKPQNPVVAEAHQVDTFHVPKAFIEYVSLLEFLRKSFFGFLFFFFLSIAS